MKSKYKSLENFIDNNMIQKTRQFWFKGISGATTNIEGALRIIEQHNETPGAVVIGPDLLKQYKMVIPKRLQFMTSSALKALTATTGNRTDCWNTPPEFVGDVLKFFGGRVGLDPCSNSAEEPNVPADKVYTEEMNGLNKVGLPTVFL